MRRVAVAVSFALFCALAAAADDGNLIEYGRGGFGDGGWGPPMLTPPDVKIYSDGRIVFGDAKGIWEGRVDPRRLARLKRDLGRNPLLKRTQLLHVKNGGLISMHGGMAYIRYGDGDSEIFVAVESHPRSGPYVALLRRIRDEIPDAYASFRPSSISFRVYEHSTWREPVAWPFPETPLAGRKSSDIVTVTDPKAIALLVDNSFGGFSWLQCNVSENGQNYSLMIDRVPGWFEQSEVALKLYELHLAGSQ
jgi:hypothetical protein